MMDGAKDIWSKWFGEDSILSKFFTLDKFLNVLSQFGHMLLSPTMPTILLGIATILVSVLGITFDWIQKLYTSLCDCFSRIWNDEQTSPVVEPQMESVYTESLIGVLGSLAVAAVGYKVSYSNSFLSTIRRLFVDINIFSRGLEGIIKLLSHLFTVLGRFIKYVVMYAKGKPDVNVLLKDQGDEMIKWAMHVEDLLDPLKENSNMMDDTFVDMINDFYFTGTVYQVQLANCGRNTAASNYVKSTVERLREVRDKLCHMGKHPYTRLTPWSLWLAGPPGIGKSTLVTYITSACLSAIKYDKRIPHVYKYEPLAKNWDTFANNPFILVDDAFCVNSPTALDSLLTAYFCVVTNAPFTPPMAHLYNKYIRVQNLGLITCSNFDFPKGEPVIGDKQAFYRRRHCMMRVEMKPEYDTDEFKVRGNLNLDKFTDEQKKNFVWLQFREYHDPQSGYFSLF